MANEHYYAKAVWERAADSSSFLPLSGNPEVDVAIVGAGITGLTTAYHLIKSGKKVAVLEALEVGKGTTGSSTGNLYAPIDERLFSIQKKHDEETMKQVVASRMAAIDVIEQLIAEFSIDCDFKRVPWHLFTSHDTGRMRHQVENEYQAAKNAGLEVSSYPPADFPYILDSITTLAGQAQFNPLSYLKQLAAAISGENCRIFEGTKVLKVEDHDPCIVHTNRGKVTAKHVVMATHTPKGIYAVHTSMEPYREYALALRLNEKLPDPGIYWHVMENSHYSVRPYAAPGGNYLLVLGQPHKVGEKGNNEENFNRIEQYARKHFEVGRIEYSWAAQNFKPADNLPYIGTSPTEKNIFIATGFAADGLVYGTLAGMIISDKINGRQNQWAKMYDPSRFTPAASAKKFLKENISVASHLLKDYLFYGEVDELKQIKPGEGKTLKLEGERVAAYRDEQGQLHLVSAICTHMGCILHWNNGEKSWDCPCHGSRFAVDGEVLEGPAYQNLASPDHDVYASEGPSGIPGRNK